MARVFITDLQALNYVLTSLQFEKPDEARQIFGDGIGRGCLTFLEVFST
jgi:hypothetical protein